MRRVCYNASSLSIFLIILKLEIVYQEITAEPQLPSYSGKTDREISGWILLLSTTHMKFKLSFNEISVLVSAGTEVVVFIVSCMIYFGFRKKTTF